MKIDNLIKFALSVTSRIHKVFLPFAKYPQDTYEEVLNKYINENTVWLDFGCGHKILSPWRLEKEKELVNRAKEVTGVDPDSSVLKKHRSISKIVVYDGLSLPFEDESFDLVTANMVVEHLDKPLEVFQEIYRVIKPGGFFIFHTPNQWGHIALLTKFAPYSLSKSLAFYLTGRRSEDVYPTFFRANSIKIIKELAKKTNFLIHRIKMIQGHPLAMGIFIPPVYIIELIWVKLLCTSTFKSLRGNIISIYTK